MEPRVQRLPLPVNEMRLSGLVLSLLKLDRLLELKLTPRGIEVRRGVEADEPVVPETLVELGQGLSPPEPDLVALMKALPLIESLDFDLERHPLTTLVQMTQKVYARRLRAASWFVAQGDHLDAFLGQDEGTVPSELFGIPVHYVPEDQLPEGKILLVGSPTGHCIDASYGVGADIGGAS